ncbi:MAG: type I methionyl aminopeptidase [Candidatus Eisenbacteria bacterium]|nr:type I methionyl aminopeptidase [Candidatus Eisenbacteria bacterium]
MINIRGEDEIELIRESSRIVAASLDLAGNMVGPGVTTGEIDREVENFIRSHGATPEFKGFHGYPAAICASVNEQVVHGIPGERELRDGDIVGIDVGVRRNGYVGDGARTFAVGSVSEEARRIMRVTRESLEAGLEVVRDGVHLSDVSHAVQTVAESAGFSVVRELAGHGVGTQLHEAPEIPNYGDPGYGPVLRTGMVLAIEPMINAAGPEVRTLGDGWTVVTADGGLSAHYEHTVAVAGDGVDILTVVT